MKTTAKNNTKLIYDTNEIPPIGKLLLLSFQHVFAMFGATILVPILVNGLIREMIKTKTGADIPGDVMSIGIALFSSGIGTLIYILCTKAKSPVYLGSSFAFITPLALVYVTDGISGMATGIITTGLVYILFAILIKIFGKEWINKLLPPVVVGPMIVIIGLVLAPNAISQMGLVEGAFNPKFFLVAMISFLVTCIVSIKAKGFVKVIPFLIGIISGYIVAAIIGIIDFDNIKNASFIEVPKFYLPFKDYHFSPSGFITMLPIAIVSIAEHIGDHMALSTIIGKDLIKDPGLERTLLGDGLATSFAGLIAGPANTTYSQNTSIVGMSKVASVWVMATAAIISIIFSFFGIITAIFSSIPDAVLGGASLLLYGFISVNGLKVLIENKVNFDNLKNVIIVSAMLVLGLGGAIVTLSFKDITFSLTGMSLAAIIGIFLNLIIPNPSEY